MAWSIDRTPVKIFVSLVLLANGALFAFSFAVTAALRGIGAVVAQAITLVVAQAVLLPFGKTPGPKMTQPAFDLATTALDAAAIVTLIFFLVVTVLLWTRFRFNRVGALIGAVVIALVYGWFVFFFSGEFAAEVFPGWAQAIALVGIDGGLILLAGATLLAIFRGSAKSAPAQQ